MFLCSNETSLNGSGQLRESGSSYSNYTKLDRLIRNTILSSDAFFAPVLNYHPSYDRFFIFNSCWKSFQASEEGASVIWMCKSCKKSKHFLSLRSHPGELHQLHPVAAFMLV